MHGLNTYDYGARQHDPILARWDRIDPLCEKYYSTSPYAYCANNPVMLVDPDGMEPIKEKTGTANEFINLLNNSPRHVGNFKGQTAANYLKSLCNTEWKWSQFRPIPAQTPYFNNKKGRYIYTKKGGWLDMVHFLFYAGKAYNYKLQKQQANKLIKESNSILLGQATSLYKQAIMDPVSEAIQDGYHQELTDIYAAPQSAYSYEDLPTYKIGAIFGADFFDPNSDLSFSEQLFLYLQTLGATDPQNAPNYNQLPSDEQKTPSRTNKSTVPVYTNDNP